MSRRSQFGLGNYLLSNPQISESEGFEDKRLRLLAVKAVIMAAMYYGVDISKEIAETIDGFDLSSSSQKAALLKELINIGEEIKLSKEIASLRPNTIKSLFSKYTVESDREILRRDPDIIEAARESGYDRIGGNYLAASLGRKSIFSSARATPQVARPSSLNRASGSFRTSIAPPVRNDLDSSSKPLRQEFQAPVKPAKSEPVVVKGYGGGGSFQEPEATSISGQISGGFAKPEFEPSVVTGQINGEYVAAEPELEYVAPKVATQYVSGEVSGGFAEPEFEPSVVTGQINGEDVAPEVAPQYVSGEVLGGFVAAEDVEEPKEEELKQDSASVEDDVDSVSYDSDDDYMSQAESVDIENESEDERELSLEDIQNPAMSKSATNLDRDDYIEDYNPEITYVAPLKSGLSEKKEPVYKMALPIEVDLNRKRLSESEMAGKTRGFQDNYLMHALRCGSYNGALEAICNQQKSSLKSDSVQQVVAAAQNFALFRNVNNENPLHLAIRSGNEKLVNLVLDYVLLPLDEKRKTALLNQRSSDYNTQEGSEIKGETPLEILSKKPEMSAMFESRGISIPKTPSPDIEPSSARALSSGLEVKRGNASGSFVDRVSGQNAGGGVVR